MVQIWYSAYLLLYYMCYWHIVYVLLITVRKSITNTVYGGSIYLYNSSVNNSQTLWSKKLKTNWTKMEFIKGSENWEYRLRTWWRADGQVTILLLDVGVGSVTPGSGRFIRGTAVVFDFCQVRYSKPGGCHAVAVRVLWVPALTCPSAHSYVEVATIVEPPRIVVAF